MRRRMIKKLSSRRGESIGETLVALLISALALMMLAGAVSSALNLVSKSKLVMDDYYHANNAVAERAEATAVNGPDLDPSALAPLPNYEVKYWANEQLSTPVIAYRLGDPLEIEEP